MTMIKPCSATAPEDENLQVAETLFEEAGIILGRWIKEAKRDDFTSAAPIKAALQELSTAWQMASKERNRVADERRKTSGVVGSYAVDYAAARDEIGRRLARLRAATDDGDLSE